MIQEDYASFELTRVLKQKGYPLVKVVKDNGDKPLFYDLPKDHPNWNNCDAWYKPTLYQVQKWLDTPTGFLDIPLTGGDHLTQALHGSPLANFINTVQRDASGARISACSLPNEFKGLPTTVTVRDVVSTYIYTNTLVVLELDKATLKRYMERSAAYFAHDENGALCISNEFLQPKVEHYNYDYFSGVDYVIDTTRPIGERITSIKLDGREMAETETVTVCINSYRSCGTGGYEFLVGQKVVADIQVDVADAIIEYITKNPQIKVDTHRYCDVQG
jgi:2',3'-cyclic-nucleotide 2'-phosphodiesterase/3'-nucleotidase